MADIIDLPYQTAQYRADKRRYLLDKILRFFIQHVLLIIFGIIFMLPFLWMVSSSLKQDTEIFDLPVSLIPASFDFGNYIEALDAIDFWRYTVNSLFYTTVATIGAVISNTFIAYGFARIKWPGRNIVFFLVLATMMLPFQVRMIPLFILFSKIGWLNTFLPLIIPPFLGNAFYIFLMRQFMMTIPSELDDAARIDGCTELGIFWRIVVPLMKPAIITIAIFEMVYAWNDFLGPLIYMRDASNYTLSIGLQLYFTQHGAEWALLMAAATMFTLPMIIIFFFAQRTFIEGISLTGIKG
ncbi:MAG: carbohydrate ABC transporter permease [Aggregatilineales bacterium]